jgi:nitrogen fixation protein NifU and related proteins
MSDVRDLYQELILEHSKNPRNFRRQEDAKSVEGYNPLCGDHFVVYLKMNGEVIQDLSFQGSGCAISKASASVMTQALKGKKKAEAEKLFAEFHDLVTGKRVADPEIGKLAVFGGVSQFPMRVKCATLAWHTVNEALKGAGEVVSTE